MTDYVQSPSGTPQAFLDATMVPQYRLNETMPALQEDASIAQSRATQDFTQRTLPSLNSANAAQGNFGSTGANTRANWAAQDYARNQTDVARMLSRNMANIAQQKILGAMGAML